MGEVVHTKCQAGCVLVTAVMLGRDTKVRAALTEENIELGAGSQVQFIIITGENVVGRHGWRSSSPKSGRRWGKLL